MTASNKFNTNTIAYTVNAHNHRIKFEKYEVKIKEHEIFNDKIQLSIFNESSSSLENNYSLSVYKHVELQPLKINYFYKSNSSTPIKITVPIIYL